MGENPKRPIVLLLTSNCINMFGVALVTTAGFSWLFAPTQLRGHTENPCIGIVAFIFIPVIFIAGLVLIAVGVFLGRRRIQRGLSVGGDRRAQVRNLALFFAGTTAVNIFIGTQGTYRAVRPWRRFSFAGKAATS